MLVYKIIILPEPSLYSEIKKDRFSKDHTTSKTVRFIQHIMLYNILKQTILQVQI